MRITGEQIDALNAQAAQALASAQIPPPLRASQWLDRHFYLSAENSAVAGPWETRPYQRAILDAGIANDDVRSVTFQKSARVGYTKMLLGTFAYFTAYKRRNSLMYLPTELDAIRTVRTDVDPTIRDVSPLREALKGDPEKRSRENTKQQKIFNGCIADILGGKSGRNYRAHTKSVVFYDELDAFEPDIDNEGSPLALGDKRLEGSTYSKSVRGSTPGIAGRSLIEEQLELADLVFERHLPCPHCGDYAPLKWAQFKYDDDDPDTVRRVCEACSGTVRYHEYPAMDRAGVWRTESGIWIDERDCSFRDAQSAKVPARENIAFRIWSAYSYQTTWTAVAAEWIAANKARKQNTDDTTRLKAFITLWLGETWEEPSTKMNPAWLIGRREQYAAPAPDGVLAIVAGVDVQVDRFEVEFMGAGYGEETWSLDYVRVYGDTSESAVYEDLDRVLSRRFSMEGAGEMGVSGVGIDSGYNADMVYAFCAPRVSRRFFALKGYAGENRPWIGNATRTFLNNNRGRQLRVIPIAVDLFKDRVYQRLRVGAPGPGYCHFPAHYGPDYFDGLTAEKRQPKRKAGRIVGHEWIKIRLRNEPLDCRVMSLATLRLVRPELTQETDVRRRGARPAQRQAPPTVTQPQPPASNGHRHAGFMGRRR